MIRSETASSLPQVPYITNEAPEGYTEAASDADEDNIFVFVIHDIVPESCDGIAFRIDKSKPRRKKDVECPHCGGVFEEVDYQTKIEVFRFSKKTAARYHKTRYCKICRGAVAVRFA